ncbi:MAG: 6-phosphogluconate dehydrogenase [Bacteroidota bacterium]
MDRVKRIFRRVLIFGGIFVFLFIAGYITFARFATFSDGNRTGKISKFSYKGVILKTWEGTLNVGGHEGGTSSNEWAFSVYPGSEEVAQKIKEAMDNGNTVNLHYQERFIELSIWGDTKYFVDAIKIVE